MRALAISGLIALVWLLPARAQAFGNCLEAGYLGYFREGLAEQPCDDEYYVTIPAASGNAVLRMIRLSASPRGATEDWLPQVEALANGVGLAMDALGTGRLPTEITVLLTDATETTDERDEVHADTTLIPGGECRVAFFKLSSGATPEEFTFTLAHEIFHCVQANSWLDAYAAAEAVWWAEGSAEYFAYLAAPNTGGQGWIDAFDAASLRTSLAAMEYEAVVFFAWLGHRGGPSSVGSFLTRMQPGDQISVLRSLVPEADWISFVENWLDGEIRLPGGQVIEPAPLATGNRSFAASGDLTLSAGPYTIDRWGAIFVADKRFDLTHASGDGHLAMKLLGSGDPWEPPPETISTCDGEKQHILYFTTTGSEIEATVSVTTDDDSSGGACCLIGSWKPTPETLSGLAALGMDIGASAIAAAGGSMSCEHDGGDWRLTFAADKTGRIAFDDHSTRCTVRAQGGEMATIGARSGFTDFDWTVRAEGNAATNYTGHEVSWTMTIKIGPVSQSHPGNDDGPTRLPSGFAFRCDETSLAIKGIYGLSTYEAVHSREPVAAP